MKPRLLQRGTPVWEHLPNGARRKRWLKREHVCTRGKGGCLRLSYMFGLVFPYCVRYSYAAILVLVALLASGCVHRPVTIVTPAGKAAFTADQIVLRVNELGRTAIAANAAGALDLKTTRIIVDFAEAADVTLKALPQGWQATLAAAWAQTKDKLPLTALGPLVLAAVQAVDVVIATLVGR